MKMLLIMWVGCLCVMMYYVALLRKAGIYPSKRVLRLRAAKWGMVGGGCFFIWFVIILVR